MAVILIATAKAANANAYVDETEAGLYLSDNRLYETKWAAAVSDDRKSALIWATKLLDLAFDWNGLKRTSEQALRWPRSSVYDLDGQFYDSETIPSPLKHATAELALSLLRDDRTADPSLLGRGIASVTVGPISVEASAEQVMSLIPDYIVLLLRALGTTVPGAQQGDKVVSLVRV